MFQTAGGQSEINLGQLQTEWRLPLASRVLRILFFYTSLSFLLRHPPLLMPFNKFNKTHHSFDLEIYMQGTGWKKNLKSKGERLLSITSLLFVFYFSVVEEILMVGLLT